MSAPAAPSSGPDPALRPWVSRAVLGVTALALASGCRPLSPAKRQILSTPEMTPATDAAEDEWYGHVEAARHGGLGGHGVGAAGGGGCGCG